MSSNRIDKYNQRAKNMVNKGNRMRHKAKRMYISKLGKDVMKTYHVKDLQELQQKYNISPKNN